jgi:hypothetical protein
LRRSPLKRRQALRAQSERAVAYQDELWEVAPLVKARADGICEVCHFAPIEHLHHKLRRSQGGSNHISNLLGVCREDHEFIHSNPAYAYEKGWLIRGNRRR